jgi:uncharacterized membrane protein HdeD (DUF308 family)
MAVELLSKRNVRDSSPLGLEQDHPRWGWYLALGTVLMVIGALVFGFSVAAIIGTVPVLGWLMVASGSLEAPYAFYLRGWRGLLDLVLGGVLGIIVGLILVMHLIAGAQPWSPFASYLAVIGIARTITAIQMKYEGRYLEAIEGIVTLLLALLLWTECPLSAKWFPWAAFGIAVILRGGAVIVVAFAVRASTLAGRS